MDWIGPVIIAAIVAIKDIIKTIIVTRRHRPGIKTRRRMFNRKTDQETLFDVSADVGARPEHLARLIEFESGWDPKAQNKRSTAKGLIQFTDSTARDLGYQNSADLIEKNPTVESQLKGPVRNYLKKYGPFSNDKELFMAVFYPKAMTWPLDRSFPDYVQRVNPGIKTVRDYMNKVYQNPDPFKAVLFVLGLGGLVLYMLLR